MHLKRKFLFLSNILFFIFLLYPSHFCFSIYNYEYLSAEIVLNNNSFYLNDSVEIFFYIKNLSNKKITLELSENPLLNYRISLYSIQKKKLELKKNFYDPKKRIPFKKFVIQPNQIHGQRFNIKDLFQIKDPGIYILEGVFSPIPKNLISHTEDEFQKKIEVRTPKVQLHILNYNYKNFTSKSTDENKYKQNQNNFQALTPYEVVEYILKANLSQDWEKYFRYIDLNLFIRNYPDFYKIYKKSQFYDLDNKNELKTQTLLDFKKYLKKHIEILGLKIKNFVIEKTVINNKKMEADIYVNIKYQHSDFVFSVLSVYSLYKTEDAWLLYSIESEKLS